MPDIDPRDENAASSIGGQKIANNHCYLVTDGDGFDERHVGYYRKRENAERAAQGLAAPYIRELDPPDWIACEDDDTIH